MCLCEATGGKPEGGAGYQAQHASVYLYRYVQLELGLTSGFVGNKQIVSKMS